MTSVKSLQDMNGRRTIITGATGGIGIEMADTLAELGSDLILIDKSSTELDKLTEDVSNKWKVNIDSFECDLEDEENRIQLVSKIKQKKLGINCLINNAAFVGEGNLSGWAVPFQEQSIKTWRRALEVNLTAAFHLCQLLTPTLQNNVGGNIINITSIYGEYGPDWSLYEGTLMGNPAAYGASKGGLAQLTRWLSTTLAPNIRVNAIAPGGIIRNQKKDFIKRYEERTPLKRMAVEEDFRGAITFLSSDMSRYVTGQILFVDGGWSAW
tara:strand:- start:8221 stop:9024 length:804 start_codon:yes stop_codon:yes gene_type:complete